MSNHTVSMSLTSAFVSWISSLGCCLLCASLGERAARDGVEVSPENFFFLFLSHGALVLLAVMNLVPNERQQRSLWRRDVLPHPANSSCWLEGRELILVRGGGGDVRWCHWHLSKLCNSSGVVWWPNGLLLLLFFFFFIMIIGNMVVELTRRGKNL